ncbi:hypothetical protein A6R68_14731 [Neotoma lepida]|uniref:G-protein coupled receptors family 1 profile domain-containing protein n=1 Tax=Neotoma lepida TaxID=56216 RepID=A0A1A6H7Z7_NEOLE|nr:hypothetical protein A6R68_14731 [Neotoma lepida]
MYYFLSNLSFLDICYTSTTIPVMLVNFFREKKTISYEGCLSQIFFFVTYTSVNESVLHVSSATIGLSPCLFTAGSYILIISAILRIPSAQGRRKAFSTCASHLTGVVVFFGTANFNYDRPREGYSVDMDILVSVLFCVVTPMLNPIIYSLRNKEVKGALRKLTKKHGFSGEINN